MGGLYEKDSVGKEGAEKQILFRKNTNSNIKGKINLDRRWRRSRGKGMVRLWSRMM